MPPQWFAMIGVFCITITLKHYIRFKMTVFNLPSSELNMLFVLLCL